jgi:iron complex outermembrane receptor protein
MVRPGNFDRVDTRFTLNVPIRLGWLEDKLFTRLAVATINTPGYSYNVTRREPLNGDNSIAFLGALRFLPTDDVTIDLTGTWSKNHNNGIAFQCVVANREGGALVPLLPPGALEECDRSRPFKTFANIDSVTSLESWGTWMVANWDVGEVPWLGDISVKSLTSWREQLPRTREDIDALSFDIVQIANLGGSILDGKPNDQRQIMQEGQINGRTLDDRLDYVGGVFGFWEDGVLDQTTYVLPPGQGNPVALNTLSEAITTIDNWSWALYGQASYDILDWLSITGGVRYTQDKKGLTFFQFDPRTGVSNADEAGDKVFEKWTPMASIAATVPDDLLGDAPIDHAMGYFTYSQGFKGGGFNGVSTGGESAGTGAAFAYDPETLDNYEIGFKLIGFERRATLNLSLFYGEYDDVQVTQILITGIGPDGSPILSRLTDNAAKGTTKGVEVELQANPIDGLLVTGNLGFTDAVYDEFPDALSDFDGQTIDRSGERFLFTPRLQTFLAAQYSFPVPGLEGPMEGWLTPRLEWAYQSSVQWIGPEVPQGTQRGYNLLNARLSYDFFDDQAQVALWAKNLLDEDYFTFVTPTVSALGFLTRTYAAPFTFGAELSWRF